MRVAGRQSLGVVLRAGGREQREPSAHAVAGAPRCACGRRSPGSGRGGPGRGPPRWASAGPTQPATPSGAAAGAVGGLAGVPIAGRVGETPVAWWPAGSVWPKPELVFRGGRGSVPESPVGSIEIRPELVFRGPDH